MPETQSPSLSMQPGVFSMMGSVDLDDKGPTFEDQWRLVHFFARILRAAETR